MARIILKSPYMKPNAQTHMDNYVRHIAYHGGAQRPADSRQKLPSTVFQNKAVAQIVKEYPDTAELYEYEDYTAKPTRANAEEFIIRAAESHPELLDSREQYVSYIATRPGAVHIAGHGLFGDADQPVILSHVMDEVGNHPGNVWTHIISLRREDAERLGYDNVDAWQDLLCSQRNTIAAAMNIAPGNFRWYASFHDKDHHPHVHLVAWSAKPAEPWLSEEGIGKIKAALAKQIFKNDLMQIYERQTEHRDALRQDSREIAAEIVRKINVGGYDNPAAEDLLLKLADRLRNLSGKKVYGYLPPDVKAMVDLIVDEMAKDERISRLYDLWYEQRQEVIRTYTDKPPERLPLSQNNDFKPVKNAVIDEAMNIVLDRLIFEDGAEIEPEDASDDAAGDNSSSDEPEIFAPDDAGEYDSAEPPDSGYYADWNEEYKEARSYLYGNYGVDQNFEIAYNLMLTEAENGNAFALYDTGRMLWDGLGVGKDADAAQEWFAKSYAALLVAEKTWKKNAYIQYRLGKMNAQGFGVDQNYESAASWYEKAVAQGNPFAAYALGGLCYRGQGVAKDYKRAFDLYLYLIAAGDPRRPNVFAMYELGRMYRDGIGVAKDKIKSDSWYRRAFAGFVALENQTKDDKLQYRLGQMCLTGTGTGVDPTMAHGYFEAAAKMGNANAMYGLGKLYLNKDFPGHDIQQAVRWLEEAAGAENQFARYTLGKLFLKGDEIEKDAGYGIHLLTQAAEQGNEWAQLLLGRTYLAGTDVPQDLSLAESMFEAAAGQGNTSAQYSLAKMHLNGQAENPSVMRAVSLLESAAAGDYEWAQYTLGKLLMQGEIIPKDILRSEKLLLAAAWPRPAWDDSGRMNPGNQYAEYMLGKLYLSGDGIPKDAAKAVYFLSDSAEQGNMWAQYQLGKMLLWGKEVEQDILRGLSLLESSAQQGNVYADRMIRSYYDLQNRVRGNASINAAMGSLRLLGHFARIMENRIGEESRRDGSSWLIDRKLRRDIEEKKQAHGLRIGG